MMKSANKVNSWVFSHFSESSCISIMTGELRRNDSLYARNSFINHTNAFYMLFSLFCGNYRENGKFQCKNALSKGSTNVVFSLYDNTARSHLRHRLTLKYNLGESTYVISIM